MASMASMFAPLLGVLLTALLLASSANATVEGVCRTAASDPNVNYNLCVSSLRSVPGSARADNLGLAVIAGTLVVKQARSTKDKVDLLLRKVADRRMKNALQSCEELYGNAISTATDATNALRRKDIGDAQTWFSAVVDAPSTCEEGFQELHLSSPLSNENLVAKQLAIIALSITAQLR